jgi:hypothetical protein
MAEALNAIMIWTGGALGAMKLLDFLLGARQKKVLTSCAEAGWIWLSDQRAGRYIALMRSHRFQLGSIVVAHISILSIVLSFIGRVYFGWRINVSLELGHPRIYLEQVWVDAVSVLVSLVLITKIVHPRISTWIGAAASHRQYLWRCTKAYLACWGILALLMLVQYPIIGFDSPVFTASDAKDMASSYEKMLGGQVGVYLVHAATALVAAPAIAELLLLQVILFASLYWLCLVWIAAIIFQVLRFLLMRIAESKDGPVLALSALLVAAGAIAKAVLGK